MSARLPDWQTRLEAVVRQAGGASFAWGRHDCVQFAAAAVRAVTGRDVLADVRGYGSELGALRVVVELGADSLAALAAQRLGPEIAPALAQPGDVGVLLPCEGVQMRAAAFGGALAVCGGAHWLVPADVGLGSVPLGYIARAWRAA